MEHMQPLQEFVDHYVKCEWKPKEEYIIHNSELHRFKIIVEHAEMASLKDGFLGIWRDEKLAEAGVNATCSDAKEFANALVNSLFYHLSPHETMHIIDALKKYINDWHDERTAVFKANPQIFGHELPTEEDKHCPY